MTPDKTADGRERPSNAQVIAELQAVALAIRLVGLNGLVMGAAKIGPSVKTHIIDTEPKEM